MARAKVPKAVLFAATSSVRPRTVVYIHGIGPKPPPSELKHEWDLALFDVDMGDRTRMAYWADILHPTPVLDGGGDGAAFTSQAHVRGPAQASLFYSEAVDEGELGPLAETYASRVAARLLGREAPAPVAGPSARVLPLPRWLRRWITRRVTEALIQDTAAYFYQPDLRQEMKDRLKRILIPEGGPYVLIAHSQGSIIAFETLKELGKSVDVPLLVTIGSPLGIQEVQDNLAPPLRIPPCVRKWMNFADLLDPVALDKGLSIDFMPAGRIVDIRVVNADSLRIRGFNPHSGPGYLRTGEVRESVRRELADDFVAPVTGFVIARDVVREMSGSTERIPVLLALANEEKGEPTPKTLEENRVKLIEEILRISGPEAARVENLKRFIAAELTSGEIERLVARHGNLAVSRVWRDYARRALLTRAGQTVQATPARAAYGAAGEGIHWAVLDTGVRPDHPHFSTHKNIATLWDCSILGPPLKGRGLDANGHGTHVSGIIAGVGKQPGDAISGVAPRTSLHSYKVLSDDGQGRDSWIIKALDHIADLNDASPELVIHGVNLSLGGAFDPTVFGCGHSPLCAELRRLWRQGVIVCLAAGNEGRVEIPEGDDLIEINLDLSIGDPANLEEAIAVGSVHAERPHLFGVSYFSSRGPTADGRVKPDVVAPGERIRSCSAAFDRGAAPYCEMSGTSMACPVVSGVLAAFLSIRREFIGHPDKVKEILLANCTDLKRDKYHQGHGLPNLVKMLANT